MQTVPERLCSLDGQCSGSKMCSAVLTARMREEDRTRTGSLDWSIREATHAAWKIQDGSMRHERQEKVWSVRCSIKGRRRRRQEEKATAETGTGLRQREGMEGGGGGGRDSAKTQRGRLKGQNKEGAKRRKAKERGKESAEEYPSG